MGEELAWLRLAERQARSYQECQDSNTSTDFLRWNKYLDDEEWHNHSKTDHQLAQIAYEVHRIGVMLAGKTMPDFDAFLVKFKDREAEPEVIDPELKGNFERGGGMKGIEVGETELDEKWQKVNAAAKAHWGMLLGGAAIQQAG